MHMGREYGFFRRSRASLCPFGVSKRKELSRIKEGGRNGRIVEINEKDDDATRSSSKQDAEKRHHAVGEGRHGHVLSRGIRVLFVWSISFLVHR
jgi:hypothetical protein